MSLDVFAWLRWLWCPDCPLDQTGRSLQTALLRFSNAEGRCWPSIPTLAGASGSSRSALLRGIREHETLGLVEVTRAKTARGGNAGNQYRIPLQPPVALPCDALEDYVALRQERSRARRKSPSDHAGSPETPAVVSPSDHAGSPETPKLLRELPNEAAEGREREAAAARKELPKNLQEALLLPVQERAQLVLDQRVAAMFVQPERWPEIVDSTAPFFKRRGIEPRLGAYARDAGVRAQVVLLAARFTVEELAWVAGNDPYLHEPGKGRGLATMSLEVVRRALAARKEQAPLSPATKRWEPPPEPEPKDLVRADEIGRFTADLVARRTA